MPTVRVPGIWSRLRLWWPSRIVPSPVPEVGPRFLQHDDRSLAELIGELTMKSAECSALWSARAVHRCAHHTREYRHPVVGPLTLTDELLRFPDDEGQRLAIFTAEPGSPSRAALRLLAGLTAEHPEPSWPRRPVDT